MKFEVIEIIDQDDGSARMIVDMDYETIIAFAKIGVIHSLERAAEKTIEEYAEDEK